MIRLTLVCCVVFGLAIYAWKDWYKSLCGLIILIAVLEHPDMPKSIFGIQGLNLWNLLFLSVVLAWGVSRRREGLSLDMPRHMTILLLLYLSVILVGFVRMMADRDRLGDMTTAYLISECLINAVKWVIPGLLFFDGCRSRSRFMMGLFSLLAIYFLLGVQVIKWIPPSVAMSGGDLSARSLKIILNEIGYHRVNLSMMLAGASWAIFATHPLAERRKHLALIIAASLAVLYAQALTAGRMGYVTCALVGLALCSIRWRKYLVLAPLVPLVIALAVPGAVERMYQGFSPESRDLGRPVGEVAVFDDDSPDLYTITAGRNIAWPYVIQKIAESPLLGFGRLAMVRTGLAKHLWSEYRESFPHPHNAYLEMLLDNGWVGFLLVFPFYFAILAHAMALFRDSGSPVFVAIGGTTCALVLALLIASVGSQTFYPREGAVGMWCAIGLMLRVYVERSRAQAMAESGAAVVREARSADRPADGPGPHPVPAGARVG